MKVALVDGVYKAILRNGVYYGISKSYTLTINPTPSDATVTFNTGTVSGKSCTVTDGTSVTYTVSKSGYQTQSATVVVTETQTINITLVTEHYSPNQVVYESSTAGSTTLNLLDSGKYEVICIAGGGGGYSAFPYTGDNYYFGGGSGSGFDCVLQLTAGSYTVVVGAGGGKQGGASAGNSQFGTSYAYKGGNGTAKYEGMGAAGASPTITYTVVSTTFNKAGNAGTRDRNSSAAGGASVYDNTTTGYGAGGRSDKNGYAGYVKVIYKGS